MSDPLMERLTQTRTNLGFLSTAGIHRQLQWRPLAGRKTYGVTMRSKPYTSTPLVIVGKVDASSLCLDGLGTWNDALNLPLTTSKWMVPIIEPEQESLQPQFHTARQVIYDLQERASIYYHGLDHNVTTYYGNDVPGVCLQSPMFEVRRSLFISDTDSLIASRIERDWIVPDEHVTPWKEALRTHSLRPLNVWCDGLRVQPSEYRSTLAGALVEAHFSLILHTLDPATFTARIEKLIVWDT